MTKKGPVLKQVRKLDLSDNDVLILNYREEDSENPEFADWLSRFMTAVKNTGKVVSVIGLKQGVRLSHVTEAEMNNLGWFAKGES